jgi:DNA-binding PadR family transcriptional regulator
MDSDRPSYSRPPFTSVPRVPSGSPPLVPPQVPPVPPQPWSGLGAGQRCGPRVRRGDVRAAILALLTEEPSNGYQIIQEIAERSGGIWKPSPGSVYPALQQLEDEGLVEVHDEDGRRTFRLTTRGREHVTIHTDQRAAPPWEAVAESVAEEMVDAQTLLMQVGMALQQVARVGSAGQLAAAAEVLTDARRALYRILADDEPDGDAGRRGSRRSHPRHEENLEEGDSE